MKTMVFELPSGELPGGPTGLKDAVASPEKNSSGSAMKNHRAIMEAAIAASVGHRNVVRNVVSWGRGCSFAPASVHSGI